MWRRTSDGDAHVRTVETASQRSVVVWRIKISVMFETTLRWTAGDRSSKAKEKPPDLRDGDPRRLLNST